MNQADRRATERAALPGALSSVKVLEDPCEASAACPMTALGSRSTSDRPCDVRRYLMDGGCIEVNPVEVVPLARPETVVL